jgi:23S rRNA-/tRNA-specific pseudouridylate synthase
MADTVLSDSVKGLDIDVPATGVSATMEIVAPKLPQAERVDKFLMTRTKLSRSALQRLFEQEKILVNGTVCKKNYKVRLLAF